MNKAQQQLAAWVDDELSRGRTRGDCADRLGITRGTLWRWLGDKGKPNLDQAIDVEETIGIRATAWKEEIEA